jgi:uncharacterized membrane protein
MGDSTRLKYLRIALVLVGIIFIFGIYSLMIASSSGWTFAHPFHMAEEESFGDKRARVA